MTADHMSNRSNKASQRTAKTSSRTSSPSASGTRWEPWRPFSTRSRVFSRWEMSIPSRKSSRLTISWSSRRGRPPTLRRPSKSFTLNCCPTATDDNGGHIETLEGAMSQREKPSLEELQARPALPDPRASPSARRARRKHRGAATEYAGEGGPRGRQGVAEAPAGGLSRPSCEGGGVGTCIARGGSPTASSATGSTSQGRETSGDRFASRSCARHRAH
jgi:hypothetical protein